MKLCSLFYSRILQLRMASHSNRQFAAAAERNKTPILDVLKKYLGTQYPMVALEIASGTGQHVEHFARYFTNITWFPTEIHKGSLASILSYTDNARNVMRPVYLDITTPLSEWDPRITKQLPYDVILCINMIHITPVDCTVALMTSSATLLKENGLLILYGPFAVGGEIFPESNVQFNEYLKKMNPMFGLRDIDYLNELSKENGLTLIGKEDMPANNNILIFKKIK